MRSVFAVGGSRLIVILAAIFALAGAAAAQSAPDFRLLEFDGRPVKWGAPAFGEGAVVRYAVIEKAISTANARNCRSMSPIDPLLAEAELDRTTFDLALADAFDAWGAVAQIEFHRSDVASADILIGADDAPTGAAFTDVSALPGVEPVGAINRALICLDPRRQWQVSANTARPQDLRYALIHEVGHAIGLNHPSPKGQIMSFDYDDSPARLRHGDVEGVRLLYGARPAGAVAQASEPGVAAR